MPNFLPFTVNQKISIRNIRINSMSNASVFQVGSTGAIDTKSRVFETAKGIEQKQSQINGTAKDESEANPASPLPASSTGPTPES